MEYPEPRVMDALHSLTRALAVHIFEDDDGVEVKMLVPSEAALVGTEWVPLTGEALDELTARGWVVLPGETELEVTPAGAYWCARYENAKPRRNA